VSEVGEPVKEAAASGSLSKRMRVLRVDLLSYVLVTTTVFSFYMGGIHGWSYTPLLQALGILMFSMCWYVISIAAVYVSRFRIRRKSAGQVVMADRL
jgi:hypothetical protein